MSDGSSLPSSNYPTGGGVLFSKGIIHDLNRISQSCQVIKEKAQALNHRVNRQEPGRGGSAASAPAPGPLQLQGRALGCNETKLAFMAQRWKPASCLTISSQFRVISFFTEVTGNLNFCGFFCLFPRLQSNEDSISFYVGICSSTIPTVDLLPLSSLGAHRNKVTNNFSQVSK